MYKFSCIDMIDKKNSVSYVINYDNSLLIVLTGGQRNNNVHFFSERMTSDNIIEKQFANTRISNGLRNIQIKHVDFRNISLRGWI